MPIQVLPLVRLALMFVLEVSTLRTAWARALPTTSATIRFVSLVRLALMSMLKPYDLPSGSTGTPCRLGRHPGALLALRQASARHRC